MLPTRFEREEKEEEEEKKKRKSISNIGSQVPPCLAAKGDKSKDERRAKKMIS